MLVLERFARNSDYALVTLRQRERAAAGPAAARPVARRAPRG